MKILSPFGPKIAQLKFNKALINKINKEVDRISSQKKLTKKYGKHVHMKKVERSEDPDMIQRYGVQSFPTIILEKKKKIKFEGERSEENFKNFLKKNKVI